MTRKDVTVVVLVVVAFTIVDAAVYSEPVQEQIKIDNSTTNCGEEFTIPVGTEYVITAAGHAPPGDCSYVFNGELKDNCMGLCYDLKVDSFFRHPNVSLTVVSGSHKMVFHTEKINRPSLRCGKDMALTVSFTFPDDPEFKPKKPSHEFSLEVFNRCVDPSNDDSITFEGALEHLENYHHGQEFEDTVHMNFVHGILVGCCLASMFLVLLFASYCYVKNSPNRGKKSTSMNFSQPKESRNPDKQPENVMLLSVKADPEKPPASETN